MPPNIERGRARLPDKRLGDEVLAATAAHDCNARARGTRRKASRVAEGADGMMLIGRSSGRENLLWVTGVEPMNLIRTHLANHIKASSREAWLHQQARHMTLMSQVKYNARDYSSPRVLA